MRLTLLILVAALLAATPVSGQAPAKTPVAPAPAAAAATTATQVPPLEPVGYDYVSAGRRDPFVSLVRRTTEASGTSSNQRPKGLAGLRVDEITMRGVIKGHDGWAAMVKGVDNRTYMVKSGTELYDGTVRTVTADAMFILQNVSDPLAPVKKREVKKLLRPTLEAQ